MKRLLHRYQQDNWVEKREFGIVGLLGFAISIFDEGIIEKQDFPCRLVGAESFTALPNLRDTSIFIIELTLKRYKGGHHGPPLYLNARFVTAQKHETDPSMRGCIHVRCVATGRDLGVLHPLQRVSRP